ncbi:splicing regulator RBM11 [Latimeria chalumnae]|uniref:splicing regulator RBM11 n=1 Tax=Latimeria chalumnae TaxID=7897 RepID=UPI0003C10BAF|nr:PREDICTED: splicing regulator RBM11 [Latimeria chalumnae]|eukprot:XP_006007960.1 PREDICTED: splicing regulator RBM11 [Latimeria chalumnae]
MGFAMMLNKQDEANRTVFVGNLHCNVKEEILYELFLQAGPLTKVTIAKDKDGKPKSFGFVCFKHVESVPYAIALLNEIRLYGRPIKLQYRSGSNPVAEPCSPCQGLEDTSPHRAQQNYRSDAFPGRSVFLTPPYSINCSSTSQEYFYWQSMMGSYSAHHYSRYLQMAQLQQYYSTMHQQPDGTPGFCYLNPTCDSVAGPSHFELDSRRTDSKLEQTNHNPVRRNKRPLDNDNQADDRSWEACNSSEKHKEHDYEHRKQKAKKKRR